MHVLIVCKSLPATFKGGIQTHVWQLSKALLDRNLKVSILTAGNWSTPAQSEIVFGRELIKIPYFPGRKLTIASKALEDIFFNLAAKKWLENNANEYDIVHLQGRSGSFFGASISANRELPIVATFHGLLDVEYRYNGQQTTWLDRKVHRYIMNKAEREMAQNVDHIIAVSQKTQAELNAYIPAGLAPQTVIPSGICPAFGKPVTKKKARWQLLFVGRLEKIKGIVSLIKAMPKIENNIQLVIIGDGPERKNIEKLISELEIERRVKLLGSQDQDHVRFWMQNSYALILPSFHETKSIVLLEAAICKKPVIAAASPGIVDLVKHIENGLLFPPKDIGQMAEAVNHLFHNPELAEQLGITGAQIAQNQYDWKSIADKTIALYCKVLGKEAPVNHNGIQAILEPRVAKV